MKNLTCETTKSWTEWFRRSNSRVVKALRDHLLPKKEKGGLKSGQVRQFFVTAQMTSIINGDNEEIDLETAEHIWDKRDRCCLLVLDSVTSAPQCIRQPRPRVYLKEGTYHTRLVIKLWADILALFEGKGRSGSSSFWSMMCAVIKSVNPSDKAQLGDFALARNEL
jgi:hypothetical protein